MINLSARFRTIVKSPILWGSLGTAGFYALIYAGSIDAPFVIRYFTGHPVEYGETLLFGIGLAALLLKVFDVVSQRAGLRRSILGAPRGPQATEEECQAIVDRLSELPDRRREEYYPRRLRAAVEYVQRSGSAAGIDDQLKYLADVDAVRQQNGHGLFRVIIWAIPILGFLGTVIGITMALNGLRPEALEESMLKMTTGLGVKFDTTALALAMSMLLMFVHFFVERSENSLLETVDRRIEADLSRRFLPTASAAPAQDAAVRQMAVTFVQLMEKAMQRQAALWQASIEAAAASWTSLANMAGDQVRKSISQGIAESLSAHVRQLGAAELALAEENRRYWDNVRQIESQDVEAMAALQAGIARQAEVLARAIEASGEVTRLQDVLNRNLAALGGARHIQQTVSGLAAAIHLLNARLTDSPVGTPTIQLEPTRAKSQAA